MGITLYFLVFFVASGSAVWAKIQSDRSQKVRVLAAQLEYARRWSEIGEAIANKVGSVPAHVRIAFSLQVAMAIEEQQAAVCFADGRMTTIETFLYPARDLVNVALVEDGNIVSETRTDRVSQAAGMAVGRLVGGPTGELIGGLSARSITTGVQVVSTLELRVTVDDTARPVWCVPFISGPVVQGTKDYHEAKSAALQWQGLCALLMRRADLAAKQAAAPSTPPPLPGGSEESFHVCRDGKDIGAMPRSRIVAFIKAGQLSPETDYYFDPQLEEWTLLHLLPTS